MDKKLKEKIICVYKITSPVGKVYIGQTIDFHLRMRQHRISMNNKSFNLYLSLREYSYDSHTFEVIEECDISELKTKERHWQDFYESFTKGLNMSLTPTDTKKAVLHELTIQKKRNINLGKKLTENAKALITGELHGMAKLVLNTQTGIYYGCLKDACESHNLRYSTVRKYFSNGKYRYNKSNFIYV